VGEDDAHHLVKSLRLRAGDTFVATDGRGGVARLEATSVTRQGVDARVLERAQVRPPAPRLWLVADAEGARADWLVEKAVELGAHAFVPVDGAEPRRRERFARLARAALKQSLSAYGLALPAEPALELARARAAARQGFAVWIAQPGGQPLAAQALPAQGDVFLVSGAARGLGPAALAGWEALPGAVRVDLGPYRLRAETAALMLLAFARASALCSGAGRETA
jgi:16S rRNA (uracil1498-N3)-methyltransferase